jgi:Inverse autotransporter, beta-domain/Right handed beta helix region
MFRRLAFPLALLVTTVLVSPAALADPKYPATIDAIGQAGTDGAHGGLEIMVPLAQDAGSMFYADARGLAGSDDGTGSLGLGYRGQIWPGWILGGYGFLDLDRGDSGETYFQGVLGAEAMSETFDFRVNGYLPQNHENVLAEHTTILPPAAPGLVIIGHQIGFATGGTTRRSKFEQPLPGFDAEAGVRVPIPDQDFRLFAGYYRFDADDYQAIAGPRARAEWRIHDLPGLGPNSRLTFDAEIRHDGVRGTDASAGLRLRIPFGGVAAADDRTQALAGLDQRMLDPIHREDHLVIGHRTETSGTGPGLEAVVADETGDVITSIYFANGTGGGDGTQGNPTTLATAVAAAGDGGLIVGLGGSGNLAGNIELQQNQILLGGASTLPVHGITSGTTATFVPGGARPTIVDTSGGTIRVVRLGPFLGSGATLKGVSVVGSNNGSTFDTNDAAIIANEVDGALVRDVDVTGAGVGVWLANSTNLVVDGFTTNALGASAIGVLAIGASNVTMTNLTIATAERGILLLSDDNVVMDQVTVSNPSFRGVDIAISSAVTLSNFQITGSVVGVQVQTNNGAVTLATGSVSGASVSGVTVQQESTTGSLVTVNNVAVDGLSGGVPFTSTGVTFLVSSGANLFVTGTGNTSANTVSGACSRPPGGTVTGTVQINGNPEPGTSC